MKIKTHRKKLGTVIRKFAVMLVGIFLSSLGVSLSLKSKLGATPVGVCPAVFSVPLKISTGTAMGALLAIFFGVQIIILKGDFSPVQVLQLAFTFIYGFFVDLTTYILSFFPNHAIWQQMIYCALGIVILALGVFTMLKTRFIMLPQDAVVGVISNKYNKEYGKIKIALDCVLTAIAAIGSLILHRKLVHVGIGTVAAAIFVGKIISKLEEFQKLNCFMERIAAEA